MSKKSSLPLSEVYRLLEPGPVVLVSTQYKGKDNVMAMSWHTMLEFNPPLVGCVISNRNFSFEALRRSKECVINIPTVETAKKVVGCGNTSGKRLNKFKRFHLSKSAASLVHAPLINDCYACLECIVEDSSMVNKYGFFVLKVVRAWIDPACPDPKTLHHRGKGLFMVAGSSIRLRSKMK